MREEADPGHVTQEPSTPECPPFRPKLPPRGGNAEQGWMLRGQLPGWKFKALLFRIQLHLHGRFLVTEQVFTPARTTALLVSQSSISRGTSFDFNWSPHFKNHSHLLGLHLLVHPHLLKNFNGWTAQM